MSYSLIIMDDSTDSESQSLHDILHGAVRTEDFK